MFGLALAAALAAVDVPEPGVSVALARERAAVVSELAYELAFTLPSDRQAPVTGTVSVVLTLPRPHRLVFDFGPMDRLQGAQIGGRPVSVERVNGHLVVPAEATVAGKNTITFAFTAGDEALNRNDDFLYTLFVPARAHLAFPCFDQPDLKARYRLTLSTPAGWEAVSNGEGRPVTADAGRVITFAETQPLPTYLFAFAAGRFSVETATRAGRTLRMFHRETDADKVARNRDEVFDLHARALDWLEAYTGIPYPFGKFDFVLIPSFQFGGMEHPGASLYNAASVLLDPSATQNQRLGRASLIAHETSHMWFGDLVTMRWFDDVWMKEVFANFMAAKIVNPSFPEIDHDLRFLLAHYPAAYRVDRTAGTNAIRQTLANLADAGQMYGPIIYEKAPIVMRQLELSIGETAFRDGLRSYLRRFAFGNASWTDLVALLDAASTRDVASWSRAWVETRGRPAFVTTVRTARPNRLRSIELTQRDPLGQGRIWPQELVVTLGFSDGVRHVPVTVSGRTTQVPGVDGLPQPDFVLPNGRGLGYGLFVLDDASRQYLLAHVESIPDALTRGSAWVTLWDNLLEARIPPPVFVDAAVRALPRETDEQNTQRMLGYLTRTFWQFLPEPVRIERSRALERLLREGMARAATPGQKAAWFNAYRDIVRSADGIAWLERVWRREEHVEGLTFAEPDEIAMALELAVRDVPGADDILRAQLARTTNADRRDRLAFVAPALAPDASVREGAFARLRDPVQRRREAWVIESLAYLNHPLRAAHAARFVLPALRMLREIQQTGDIFFPTRWMESTLWGHQSGDVADAVRQFLRDEPRYPERLRWTILSAADDVFRTAAVVGAGGR